MNSLRKYPHFCIKKLQWSIQGGGLLLVSALIRAELAGEAGTQKWRA